MSVTNDVGHLYVLVHSSHAQVCQRGGHMWAPITLPRRVAGVASALAQRLPRNLHRANIHISGVQSGDAKLFGVGAEKLTSLQSSQYVQLSGS